jgi:hypothetical protein
MRNVAAAFSEDSDEREIVRFAKPYSVQIMDFPRTTVDYPEGFWGTVHPAIAAAARADGVLDDELVDDGDSLVTRNLDAVSLSNEAKTGKISFEG